jgi:hypothetical protein
MRTCGSCFHWRSDEKGKPQGTCRAELPQTVQMSVQKQTMIDHGRQRGPMEQGLQVISFWPPVAATETCGRWKPRDLVTRVRELVA